MLVGREAELARVRALLEAARDGRSRALLLAGDAGIGKTALLDAALAEAAESELLVVRARGLQSESDIPFAGLSELLGPLLARLGTLPPAQAGALRAALALGGAGGDALPDRFAVSAAVLSLLAGAAEERPALVAVDDVQWLDASSLEALLFAFRRLRAEGIAVLATLRTGYAIPAPWMERVEVGPLADADARALLGSEIAAPVAERLRPARPGTRSPCSRSRGCSRRPSVRGASRSSHRSRRARVSSGPSAAASASCPRTRAARCWWRRRRTAAGCPRSSPGSRRSGSTRMHWSRPRRRSCCGSRAAGSSSGTRSCAPPPTTRRPRPSGARCTARWRRARRAGAPSGRGTSPPRRSGPTRRSRALEAAAADARRRGAIGSAARDLARAAQLTPEPETRARRLLTAAADTALGGEAPQARGYLAEAETLSAEPGLRSELRRLRANIDLRGGRPAEARDALTAEAAAAEAEDPLRAAGLYVEAAVTHMITADMHELAALAERGRALAEGHEPGLALLADLLIGESAVLQGETARGDALLRRGDPLVLEGDMLRLPQELVGMVGHCALWLEQFERAERILRRIIAAYRDASAIVSVVYPLTAMAEISFRLGRWAKAEAGVEEALTLAEQTGHRTLETFCRVVRARVGAGRGLEEQVRADLEPVLAGLGAEGGTMRLFAIGALGHLELSLGRAEQAADALAPLVPMSEALGLRNDAHVMWEPDLAEALIRAGREAQAADAVALLERRAALCGGRRHRAVALRCAGLLAGGDGFRAPLEAALALHAKLPMPFEQARTQLVLGERLRRAGERAGARAPLRAALETFERLGARAWAARAGGELRAAGETAPARRAEPAAERLTPDELQVALLVAQGMTNREAAAALFLSPKTIEYHLGQIYRKLDVRGRAQLARVMATDVPA